MAGQKKNKNIKDWSSLLTVKKSELYGCGLIKLPDQIGILAQITWLDLGYNKLSILPESIGNLILLQYLRLYKNNLLELPVSIGKLINLRTLDIEGNKLKTFP